MYQMSVRRGVLIFSMMSGEKPRAVSIVKKTTHIDKSDIFIDAEEATIRNEYNNNLHFHSFYELEFIISGCGKYEINNTVYDIAPGALFMVTPADYLRAVLRRCADRYGRLAIILLR